MPLPGDLTTIIVTGNYPAGDSTPDTGTVVFAPSSDLADSTGGAIIRARPIVAPLYAGTFRIVLLCTDNANLAPQPWYWVVTENIDGAPARTRTYALPSTLGASVDLAQLVEVTPGPALVGYIATASQMSVSGTPSAGQVLTALSATTADWEAGGGAPSDTVEAADSFDVDPDAGTATEYSRGDHTHGMPALPAASTGAAGVVEFESSAAAFQADGVAAPGTGGKAADSGHAHPLQPWQFLITAYGAVGDIVCVTDAVTNASAVVTSASGKFTPGMVGRTVVGKGFLTSGVTSLVTTIASYQSANQVTLAAAATSSATGLQMVIGTDDTAHIQAAIDAAMAYRSPFGIAAQVVTPFAPGGLGYMIAGPLKNSDTAGNAVYNSQLTTGLHSDRLPGLTLEFVGPVDAGGTRHWNQDYPTFTGGSWFSAGVFASQAAQATTDPHSISNGGNPSCLGGPTGKFGYGTTGTNPQFNNLTVRMINMSIINTHSSSGWSYCPFNFYGTARAHLVRCGFGTAGVVQYYTGAGGSGGNTDFTNPSTFSGGASIGGLLPAAGNNADSIIEDCTWNGGFTYGPLIGEHAVCKGMNRSLYNWIGVNVAGTYGDGGAGAGSLHAIDLGQFCVEACTYHLGVWGAGAAGIGPYVYGTLDTEGTVQVRGVTNIAANLQALSGELRLAGSPTSPTFTFPTNLHLIKDTQTRGPVASPGYVLGTAQINTFWRDATVTISGGTVTAVKVSALAGGAAAPTMTTLAGFTAGTFRVPAGCWWEIDGSVAPTNMQWVLD